MNEVFSPVYGVSFNSWYIGFKEKEIEGHPSYVEFDAAKILKNHKWLIGFYHTHPNMSTLPSDTDFKTMEVWCDTVGKDLICLIANDKGTDAWWFNKKLIKFYLGNCIQFKRLIIGKY